MDRKLAVALALFVATIAVYAQVAGHEFLNWDDPQYVTANPRVKAGWTADNVVWAFTTRHAFNWHPLTWISLMTDVELFGLRPGPMLLTNVVLHALNAVLLLLFLRRATGREWPGAIVAALFALHPLHVESVAWLSERKDVLSTFFFLITLLLYVAWAQSGKRSRHVLACIAFALALLAKPMVVTLPFVLLLLDWWPLRRWGRFAEKIPFFLLIIPTIAMTLRAQSITPLPLPMRLGNAAISYFAYLGKTFWPVKLAAIYPHRGAVSWGPAMLAVTALLAISAGALVLARRRPYLLIGWLWYLGTLVPVIGIVQVGQISIADRYTYVPLIGIFVALVWLADDLAVPRPVAAAATALVLVLCTVLTYRQIATWHDTVTLFRHALAVTSDNRAAHTFLGEAYLVRHENAAAVEQFRTAMAMNDADVHAHAGLGFALARQGDRDGAIRELRKAVELDPSRTDVYRELGLLELASGRASEASAMLGRAAQLGGGTDFRTQATLAATSGDADRAIDLFRRAIEQEPNAADLRNNLAALLTSKGRDTEALDQYSVAVRLSPQNYDARMNNGSLLTRMRRGDEALTQFAAAATTRPSSPEPHIYIAIIHANHGRIDRAIAELEQAIAIDHAAANRQFTEIVQRPFRERNIDEYLEALRKALHKSSS